METIVFFEYSAYAETGDRLKIPITNFKEIFKLLTIEHSWRERIYVARSKTFGWKIEIEIEEVAAIRKQLRLLVI